MKEEEAGEEDEYKINRKRKKNNGRWRRKRLGRRMSIKLIGRRRKIMVDGGGRGWGGG